MQNNIQLIIGLGNIGDVYANTRHNAGWWMADIIQQNFYAQTPWQNQTKMHGAASKAMIKNQQVLLLKPNTYMNNSGVAASSMCAFYKIPASKILVIHDELDLPAGSIKLKLGGSAGGHNGLKSIDQHLGTNKYWRIRIGINHPRNSKLPTIQNQSVSDYVLHVPSKEDIKLIHQSIQKAIENIHLIISGEMEKAMNIIHAV